MPTYEYACRACDEHFEVVQSFKDDPLTDCPSCDGQLRKVFSAAGIIFKGSGWHSKDYASSSSRGEAKDGSSDSTSSAGSSAEGSSGTSSSGSDSSDASGSSGSSSTSSSGERKSA